jgi:hypothetical protein
VADTNHFVAVPPQFVVKAADGQGVAGAHVRIRATGGSIASDSTSLTSVSGIVRIDTWRLGPADGPDSLVATLTDSGYESLPAGVITARARLRSTIPATMRFLNAHNLSDTVGHAVSVPINVSVQDSAGFGLPGLHIQFLTYDGGTIESDSAVTDSLGLATPGRWTLGPMPGLQTLLAILNEPVPITTGLTVTAVPAEATTLDIVSGNNQDAAAGTAVPLNPTVIVHTATGVPLAGVFVEMYPATGGGHVPTQSVYTDSTGHASVGPWTLGNPGDNTLIATAPGIGSVTFHATAH